MFTEMYQRGMAGFARFEEILHVQPLIRDPARPVSLPAARGEIRFDHLSFGYLPDRPVLKDLNFSIHAGETVAFVGETGTGKTTLVSLLLRFYDPTEGRILLDGMIYGITGSRSCAARSELCSRMFFFSPIR